MYVIERDRHPRPLLLILQYHGDWRRSRQRQRPPRTPNRAQQQQFGSCGPTPFEAPAAHVPHNDGFFLVHQRRRFFLVHQRRHPPRQPTPPPWTLAPRISHQSLVSTTLSFFFFIKTLVRFRINPSIFVCTVHEWLNWSVHSVPRADQMLAQPLKRCSASDIKSNETFEVAKKRQNFLCFWGCAGVREKEFLYVIAKLQAKSQKPWKIPSAERSGQMVWQTPLSAAPIEAIQLIRDVVPYWQCSCPSPSAHLLGTFGHGNKFIPPLRAQTL